MTNCTQCGAALAEGAAVCGACGAVVAAPAAAPVFGAMLNDWQASATRPSVAGATSVIGELKASVAPGRPVPQLALVTAGVAALAGLLFGISAIKSLIDLFRYSALFSGTVKLAAVLLFVVGLAVAAFWVGIAWLARGGSRITVPLIYVAGAASVLGGFSGLGSVTSVGLLARLGALLALGAIALTFVPEVRAHLASGPVGPRPASLVAGEGMLIWFGVTAALLGVAYLLLGLATKSVTYLGVTYGPSASGYYIVAIALIAAAVAAIVFAAAVGRGDATARLIVSGAAVVLLVLVVIGSVVGRPWYHVITLASVAALLWLATDARVAFGDPVLDLNKLGGGTAQTPPPSYEQPSQQSEPPSV
ncbi:MAG: hypothetical protein QOG52_2251 [Frankiaceae bacterium]|nr:hypothetical protein [Frankiaceae bacterium]